MYCLFWVDDYWQIFIDYFNEVARVFCNISALCNDSDNGLANMTHSIHSNAVLNNWGTRKLGCWPGNFLGVFTRHH
jgi:hypothetical protein